jgi:hypothetical protein
MFLQRKCEMWSFVTFFDHYVVRVGGREEFCLIGFTLILVNWIEEDNMNTMCASTPT